MFDVDPLLWIRIIFTAETNTSLVLDLEIGIQFLAEIQTSVGLLSQTIKFYNLQFPFINFHTKMLLVKVLYLITSVKTKLLL